MPLPRRATVVFGALRSFASLMLGVSSPPMSSWVMKLAVGRGSEWFGSVVG